MGLYQSRIEPLFGVFRRIFGIRFDKSPIQTVEDLGKFVQTRASYVAQTSLYGYLKTRMGTRYPQMFEDEVFSKSIAHAKWKTYASCLSDLTVFAAGTTGADGRMTPKEITKLAQHIYHDAVDSTFDDDEAAKHREAALKNFDARRKKVAWEEMHILEKAFTQSPIDLIKFAPVVDQFKVEDREIVINSTRFRWRDIREQLRKRIDPDAVCADWKQQT